MTSYTRLTGGLSILLSAILIAFAFGALEARARPSTHFPDPADAVAPVPAFKHIVVLVLENKDYTRVIGSDQAPYLSALARQYGVAANYYGIRHPSLPNYLALLGGDTFGVKSDCTNCFVKAPNLVDQLEAGGRSWRAYMEDMPSPCFVGDAKPLYQQKHNPFIYFDSIRTDPARCNKIVPLSQLTSDLQANTVPDFVWITPNMCNDMHNCPIATGDTWLKTWVPQILASPAWQDHGVLFITFDEGDGSAGCCTNAAGGRLATLVISPLGRPGFTSTRLYTHYSLLRTIETSWKLPLLGQASCDCALPMADFFTKP